MYLEELTDSVYTRCDNGHTPDDISDCTTHETAESSCCLFTYGQDTGCVLIGFKYLGSKTVGDMVVNCESKFIKSIVREGEIFNNNIVLSNLKQIDTEIQEYIEKRKSIGSRNFSIDRRKSSENTDKRNCCK